MLKLRCPSCGVSLKVATERAGQLVRCPRCRVAFEAPRTVAEPAALADSGIVQHCPVCNEPQRFVEGSCRECGYKVPAAEPSVRPVEGTGAVPAPAPLVCGNCRSANPASETLCGRCGSPLPRPSGSMLDHRYRIVEPLALGGFGWVYHGEDVKEERQVAIKEMVCTEPANRAAVLNFFIREARILESLQELPIVPRKFDFRQDGQSAYLVMELIEGRNLNQVLEERGRGFRPQQVVDWAIAIGELLDHMHRHAPPLIYRDLKPENLMLLEDGGTIRMIDFGTARDVARGDRRVMGVFTPGYAPPEQELGAPEPRSDLFALAATVFQLLTNREPRGSQTPLLRSIDPRQPPWLEEWIRINLSENPNDRYDSARAVLEDLRQRRVTTHVFCAGCGRQTLARGPYCTLCAAPLTAEAPLPCRKCRQTNRTGSRYCIFCGAALGGISEGVQAESRAR